MKSLPDVFVGAQRFEQQVPPQVGAPASAVEQTVPFESHPLVPGADTTPQIPSVAPAAFVHTPPQHSKSAAHTSLTCPQKETASEHSPPLHSLEQH